MRYLFIFKSIIITTISSSLARSVPLFYIFMWSHYIIETKGNEKENRNSFSLPFFLLHLDEELFVVQLKQKQFSLLLRDPKSRTFSLTKDPSKEKSLRGRLIIRRRASQRLIAILIIPFHVSPTVINSSPLRWRTFNWIYWCEHIFMSLAFRKHIIIFRSAAWLTLWFDFPNQLCFESKQSESCRVGRELFFLSIITC